MIVVDEYLAIRSLLGDLPTDLPDEPLALTTSAHWRILQRIHSPGAGQLSQALSALSPAGRAVLRKPELAVLDVLDPRPLLDDAAALAATYGATGWLVAETLTAALTHGRQLWFGNERNIGRKLRISRTTSASRFMSRRDRVPSSFPQERESAMLTPANRRITTSGRPTPRNPHPRGRSARTPR